MVSINCYASLDCILIKVDSLSTQDLKEWKRILFYKKSLLSNEYGLIDDEKFYLNKDGKKEPLLEMKSTLKAFYQNNKTSNDSAQCIFLRKLLWLKSKLDDPNAQIPFKNCKKLDDWLERIQGKSISIVFSSSYVNNSASMFEHTFLKIHRARHSLTDFGANFSAKPNTTFYHYMHFMT